MLNIFYCAFADPGSTPGISTLRPASVMRSYEVARPLQSAIVIKT